MKKSHLLSFVSILFASLFLFAFTGSKETKPAEDYNACIVKAKSEWGAVCSECVEYKNNKRVYDDTYTVYLQNTCNETLDIMWAVQEDTKKWRCFPERVIAPNDTVSGFACKGTGKFMYWVKKAGDQEVAFPTESWINENYKE